MPTNDGMQTALPRAYTQENDMPKNSGSGQPRLFSRRLIKIMTVMERFRAEAEARGHQPFADALGSCTLEIAGGNMDCPLGRLVVDESVADDLVGRLVDRANRLRLGSGLETTTDVGPLINSAASDKVAGYVGVGTDEGVEPAKRRAAANE